MPMTMTPDDRRAYDRRWHAARSPEQRARKLDIQAERRHEIASFIQSYKTGLVCACGEYHPACLDFHHRDGGGDKAISVANAVGRGWSKQRLLAEMAKCDVICANCHRKLHYEQRNPAALTTIRRRQRQR